MRPDQHKKRKNAEYKKKHGIPQQKKNNDNKELGQTHEKTLHHEDKHKHLKPKNKRRDSDEDSGEGEKSDHEQRSFSRRQIESNWDRYKDDELGEESEPNALSTVTKIGVDFQVLLDKTVGQTSQFHFEGEKEWEELKADEANCKVGSDLMSIDCSSLALVLREIPLDRRLEIDKKYFEDENLNVNHNPTSLTNGNLRSQINTEKLKQTNYQRNFNFSKPNKPSQQLKEKEKDTTVQDQSLSATQKIQPDTSHTQKTSHIQKTSTNCNAEEVDLDQLLGLETTQGKSNTGVVEIHQNKIYEDHIPVAKDNTKLDTVPKLSKPPPQETKGDLEDWLDSILD